MAVQSSPHIVVAHSLITENSMVPKLPEAVLSIDLPQHEYKTSKTVCIPFDPRTNNGVTFNNLHDTLLFIGKHCIFHHHTFNKSLTKMYLTRCRIIGHSRARGLAPVHFSKRQFDTEFARVSRELGRRH
jgi:hypothetical protein